MRIRTPRKTGPDRQRAHTPQAGHRPAGGVPQRQAMPCPYADAGSARAPGALPDHTCNRPRGIAIVNYVALSGSPWFTASRCACRSAACFAAFVCTRATFGIGTPRKLGGAISCVRPSVPPPPPFGRVRCVFGLKRFPVMCRADQTRRRTCRQTCAPQPVRRGRVRCLAGVRQRVPRWLASRSSRVRGRAGRRGQRDRCDRCRRTR